MSLKPPQPGDTIDQSLGFDSRRLHENPPVVPDVTAAGLAQQPLVPTGCPERCRQCGEVPPMGRHAYCSRLCQDRYRRALKVRRSAAVCLQCGETFQALKGGRFCSSKCRGDNARATGERAGPRNPRWQGGIATAPGANMRYKRRTEAKYPDRAAARRAVHNAVRGGRLVRQPCEECGAAKTTGHHDDYSKPLEVRWLCRPCHDEHHAAERQEQSE